MKSSFLRIIFYFVLVLLSACRYNLPIISINSYRDMDTIRSYSRQTGKMYKIKKDSIGYFDTTLYISVRSKLSFDFTNRSLFAKTTIYKFYDNSNNLLRKRILRKVPAFMYDGYVKVYNKQLDYQNNRIIRKEFSIFQHQGVGGHRIPIKLVEYDKNRKRSVFYYSK